MNSINLAAERFVDALAEIFIEGRQNNLVTNETERMMVCNSILRSILPRSFGMPAGIFPDSPIRYATGTPTSVRLPNMPDNFILNQDMKALLDRASGSVVFGDMLEGMIESGICGGREYTSPMQGQQQLQGIESLPQNDPLRIMLNSLAADISIISAERWAKCCHRLIRFWRQPRNGWFHPGIMTTAVLFLVFWPEYFHYARTNRYEAVEAASRISPKVMEAMAGRDTVALHMIAQEARTINTVKTLLLYSV